MMPADNLLPVVVSWQHSTSNSIDLKFVPPHGTKFARFERERCRSGADAQWMLVGAHFKSNMGTVGGLQPSTVYIFRARGVKQNGTKFAWGRPSDGIMTLSQATTTKSSACLVM